MLPITAYGLVEDTLRQNGCESMVSMRVSDVIGTIVEGCR